MGNLSRREFVAMAGATLAASRLAQSQQAQLTAGDVVDRIKKNLGIPWNSSTFRDTYKIGGPEIQVKGIATTFGTNISVMQKAVKAGLNMIITHEPTFWSDADLIELVKDDPLYHYKIDYAAKNNMVVWRCHDHAHAHHPDLIWEGWNKGLGWERYEVGGDRGWTLPPTTLRELAQFIAKTLPSGTRSIRCIGDPNLPVTKAVSGRNLASMASDADCVISSDSREYDCFEYARDSVRMGIKRGYIYITHEAAEDVGMQNFANWLKPFVPELPIQYISTTDEFWNV
jgi:putative NIF3 family GTP cyclohydrolase 1 type 2